LGLFSKTTRDLEEKRMGDSGDWIGWRFLRPNDRLGWGDGDWKLAVVGETQRLADGAEPFLWGLGFHASKKAMDALEKSQGEMVCRVRLSGEITEGEYSAVASERTVLVIADAVSVLHEFACILAESVLNLTGDGEPACRNAIDTKRRWVRGEASYEELIGSREGVCSNRNHARDAAWYATLEPSRHAAQAAARCVEKTTAWQEVGGAMEATFTKMLNKLLNQEAV
jgi:hypothetical protein